MKYVDLNATTNHLTGVINPQPYTALLSQLAPSLPAGARVFATDPLHYDFSSLRCVKDLAVDDITFHNDSGQPGLAIRFRHNCWKHEEDLIITYSGVSSYALRSDRGSARWGDLSSVILDEVLPHEFGCSHEIAFLRGTLTIVAADLVAAWIPSHCPEQREPPRPGQPSSTPA